MAALANFAQRRITPVFPPHSRTPGGAPRASRRFFAHKILNMAALPVLPACALAQIRRQFRHCQALLTLVLLLTKS